MSHVRRQYAGFLALFIVLSGTSYAVASGTIGSLQIRNNSVRSVDVRDGSLLAKDFGAGQLKAGAAGAVGLTGAKGDTGPKGDAGAPGAKGDTGPKGDSGAGTPGPKGDTGAKGDNGATGASGPTGSVGPQGKTGPTGPTGAAGHDGQDGQDGQPGQDGQNGFGGLVKVFATSDNNSDSAKSATAVCPAGKVTIGSGAAINGAVYFASPDQLQFVGIERIVPSDPTTVPGNVYVRAEGSTPPPAAGRSPRTPSAPTPTER